MKKIIKYNIAITLLQLLIFAILLFVIFFIKFSMDQNKQHNKKLGIVIIQNEYYFKG